MDYAPSHPMEWTWNTVYFISGLLPDDGRELLMSSNPGTPRNPLYQIPEGWEIVRQRRGIITIKPIKGHGNITTETRGNKGACEHNKNVSNSFVPNILPKQEGDLKC